MGVIHTTSANDVVEGGITELVGINETLSASKYSASVGVTIDTSDAGISGEIVSVLLVATELGSGAIFSTAGRLYVFDADPATTADAAALAASGADHKKLIGTVKIASTDWGSDANGGAAFASVAIPFHQVNTLYFVFQPDSGATQINSAAGDDEELYLNFWYRREK